MNTNAEQPFFDPLEDEVRKQLVRAMAHRKPEGFFREEDGMWLPTERENVEGKSFGIMHDTKNPMRYRFEAALTAHSRALVDAFFAGREVPPDVVKLCNRAEAMREHVMRAEVERIAEEASKKKNHAEVMARLAAREAAEAAEEAQKRTPAFKLDVAVAKLAKLLDARVALEKKQAQEMKRLDKRISSARRSMVAYRKRAP